VAALLVVLSLALAAPAVAAEAPTVTRVELRTDPAAGGTSVTITGTGFTGATAVQFGSTNAATFEVEEVLGGEPYICEEQWRRVVRSECRWHAWHACQRNSAPA
jgi:hypothetical protein